MHDLAARFRNPDLLRRIGVTLAVLLVYRIGCWVPLPGIDVKALAMTTSAGISPTTIERISIMALGIVPLLSALVLAEMAMIAWPRLRAWRSDANNGARLDGWVLAIAMLFATLQASGIATALEDIRGLVPDPGLGFRAGIVASLVAATAVIAWLASVITRHGVGSGFWILVAMPHVISFGEALFGQAYTRGSAGVVSIAICIGFLGLCIAVLGALTKTAPPLARADEPVWAPILGFALANWMLTSALLVRWLTLPAGQGMDFDTEFAGQSAIVLPLITVPLVVILRRRGADAPLTVSDAVSAAPLAIALTALVLAGTLLTHIPAQPLIPGMAATLILAAVGLAIANTLGKVSHTAPSKAAGGPSTSTP